MESLTFLYQYGGWGLLALRIAIGTIFFVHGKSKWAMWKSEQTPQMPPRMLSLMRLLAITEPLGAIAVLAGFLTQLAALGLGIIMVGAIFMKIRVWKVAFFAQNTTGWEFDFMILAGLIALFFLGGGSISIDRALFKL